MSSTADSCLFSTDSHQILMTQRDSTQEARIHAIKHGFARRF